jgi:DNA processing protein
MQHVGMAAIPPAAGPTRALLDLLRTHGNGRRVREALLEGGSPGAALAIAGRWPRDPDRPAPVDRAERIAADLAWLAVPGRHLVSILDPDFPPLLRESPLAPAALWVVGEPARLWAPQIAIVGARGATPAGIAIARDFATALSRAGLTVTSGLAEGIDIAAHRATLEAGGATIAVFGTGLDHIYPKRHAALAARIPAAGALVSEFPPEVPARPAHFPRRNRIIAGLALGTLVVEAGLRSGSLVTARLAGDQGREVFAIPGSIHNPLARGCHRLIRDGATLVEEAGEVLAALAPLASRLGHAIATRLADDGPVDACAATPACGSDAARVLRALAGGESGIDTLVAATGLDAARVSAALVMLELEGRAAQAIGGRWMRVVDGRRSGPETRASGAGT